MDVLVSPAVPTSKRVRELQRLTTQALRNNSAWMSVGDVPWELIAIIIPGKHSNHFLITFALRSSADNCIRAVVGATPDGEPMEIDTIFNSPDGYLDPELFLGIATRACEAIGIASGHVNSNTVH